MTKIEEAETAQTASRLAVRDLVQRAYEAGVRPTSGRVQAISMPQADEITRALADLERKAVLLAHARMEETARMCGFEGLTEALGYLVSLRDNPIAVLLRDALKLLAEREYIDAHSDWGQWRTRATAAVGTHAPPPEVIEVEPFNDGGATTDKT